jgi:hypothetical protein
MGFFFMFDRLPLLSPSFLTSMETLGKKGGKKTTLFLCLGPMTFAARECFFLSLPLQNPAGP